MKPHLERKEEFKQALKDYKVSDEGKNLLKSLKMVLLTSPTASGRNTVINKLVETGKYEFIVSDTTRPKRSNNGVMEQNGVEYWFKSEDEVLEGIKKGLYIEAEVIFEQQVSGTSVEAVKKISNDHKIAIGEVDFGGMKAFLDAKPDLVSVLLLPPSFDVWMKRLVGRGEMTTEEVSGRLKTAEKILESAQTLDHYRIVVNDKLEDTVEKMRRLVEDDEYTAEEHEHGQAVAWQILGHVKQELSS